MAPDTTVKGTFGRGELELRSGRMAKLADGAVEVRMGDTVVLVTAVVGGKKEGFDFFPLNCNYEEKMYAAGKISGGFFKREGRPSEEAVLVSRLIDRPIRPLFPKGCRNNVQIIATVLSADKVNRPDIAAMNGASAALLAAGAPIAEPMGAVRIGKVDGKLVVNPVEEEREKSSLDLIVAATATKIMMVEAGANEIPEAEMLEAFQLAQQAIQDSLKLQNELAKKLKPEAKEAVVEDVADDVVAAVQSAVADKLGAAFRDADKQGREAKVSNLGDEVVGALASVEDGDGKFPTGEVKAAFDKVMKAELRRAILTDGERPDGRGVDDIRPIACEVDVLPRTHGSALFTRGDTQGLSITTLGTPGDEQIIDTMLEDTKRRYMHHYNFPPYSTGEAKPMRGAGRREIGHGALAERALVPVIPSKEDFPYTIRVVTEILASNGSSSMASVCGSTMSLMASGVPISKPVSGIAMGLITDGDTTAVLTDIQGAEDFAGDMDFKVAGTADGITALQMDMKVVGIPFEVMATALDKAKHARLFILEKMLAAVPEVREMSPLAPRITSLKINPDKIRVVIGPGGKMINEIIDATGVSIDIEDDGTVMIGSTDGEAAKKAIDWIKNLTAEPEIGKVYDAKVVKLMAFGAFVEFMPGKEGLVHISQMADHRVEKVEDVVKEGDQVKVKLTEVDAQGRNNLSMKDVKDKE